MSASTRGVATGLFGSAAVLLVAAFSLTAAHATDDNAKRGHAAKAAVVSGVRVQPAASTETAAARPAWLRRLLSRSDLEPPPKRS